MRFKVPQNIDMQDRILGPLTMLQFIEAVLGGGLAYITYVSLGGAFGFLVAAIIALLTAAIVFIKINERSFGFFMLSLVQYIMNPKERVWHKGSSNGMNVEIYQAKPSQQSSTVKSKKISKREMEELAHRLDSQ